MKTAGEFHYRLRQSVVGHRPGSHASSSLGTGQGFAGHARLFDLPDPRRLDLRASLRNSSREWLVRTYRQRAAVAVHAVVDVSASMFFGGARPKLARVADFAEAMGYSAFKSGDAAGLVAFDGQQRDDLFLPARHSRGAGEAIGGRLRHAQAGRQQSASSSNGLQAAAERLGGRHGLIFLVSDFHWPLAWLTAALDVLAEATVVPLVVWDAAETMPPASGNLLSARDSETGRRRTVLVNRRLRAAWESGVAQRRAQLEAIFVGRGLRPFYMPGDFDAESLSRYFFEDFM